MQTIADKFIKIFAQVNDNFSSFQRYLSAIKSSVVFGTNNRNIFQHQPRLFLWWRRFVWKIYECNGPPMGEHINVRFLLINAEIKYGHTFKESHQFMKLLSARNLTFEKFPRKRHPTNDVWTKFTNLDKWSKPVSENKIYILQIRSQTCVRVNTPSVQTKTDYTGTAPDKRPDPFHHICPAGILRYSSYFA